MAGMCLTNLLFDENIAIQRKAGTLDPNHPLITPDFTKVASAVFSEPPIATVGLTEDEALEQCAGDSKVPCIDLSQFITKIVHQH